MPVVLFCPMAQQVVAVGQATPDRSTPGAFLAACGMPLSTSLTALVTADDPLRKPTTKHSVEVAQASPLTWVIPLMACAAPGLPVTGLTVVAYAVPVDPFDPATSQLAALTQAMAKPSNGSGNDLLTAPLLITSTAPPAGDAIAA
jgi:hypothetical protein